VISWRLAAASHVDLGIYNLVGQKVANLVSGWQHAGFHKVEWNAWGMASGVYLCRLTTGEGLVKTRKLLLIK
jgi:hypothetical protein